MTEHEQLWLRLQEIAPDGRTYVTRDKRDALIDIASACLPCAEMSPERKIRIRGLLLATYQAEYRYAVAEKVAERLIGHTSAVPEAACVLGEYLTNTRRYDQARTILQDALLHCGRSPVRSELRRALSDCEERASGRKAPYRPVPREDKERVLADFRAHLVSLGVDMNAPRPVSSNMKKSACKPGFRTFVAYDLETTGLDHALDNITEIGAVRVVDGRIVEQFQQLVKPHGRSIPPVVEKLTGITNEMVADAPAIQEVLPCFVGFLGDDVLMGYNSAHFDDKFLFRDANLCRQPIGNRTFDLLPWSKSLVDTLHLSPKGGLAALSRDLNIVNPQAHRALADAITTARVYLELLNRMGL